MVVAIPVFTPTKSTWPMLFVPMPDRSVLKSVLRSLMSWSFRNTSVGENTKFFVPVGSMSVSKSPNLTVVKSVVFSRIKALVSVVKVTNSVNCISKVSGSIIWTR